MRNFLILTSAVLLNACAAGPDYRAPDTAPAQLLHASAPHFSGEKFEAQWWQRFNDPQLNELVNVALNGNHEMRIAVARVREARALLNDAEWDRLPVLAAGAAYQAAEGQVPGSTTDRVKTESYRLGLDAVWELDLFGRISRSVEAAEAQAGAAEADRRAVYVSVIAEVVRNYFELRGAEQRLAVALQNRDTQRETLRLTQVRYDAGASSELDVASASARRAALEAAVPQFEAAAQRIRHRLAVLLGQRPQTTVLPARLPVAVTSAQELPIGEVAPLLRRRPDIVAAERRLATTVALEGVASAELFPRISVGGFVGFFSGQGSALLESGARAWSITPSVSWPALDFGSARARVRAAGARSEAALDLYEQVVLLALEETENALLGYSRNRERLVKLLEQSAASRRAAELARIRYREGASDFLVLLDAERTQLQAEDAVVEAETAVNTAAVAVYRALGGGWDVAALEVL